MQKFTFDPNTAVTRVNNDSNGNGRAVVHYIQIASYLERTFSSYISYAMAVSASGGKAFDNKQYGGGIVFHDGRFANDAALLAHIADNVNTWAHNAMFNLAGTVYVTMIDKCMSGWGKAEGKNNVYCVACPCIKSAEIVARNAAKRPEMKQIKIVYKAPRDTARTLVTRKLFGELGTIWTCDDSMEDA